MRGEQEVKREGMPWIILRENRGGAAAAVPCKMVFRRTQSRDCSPLPPQNVRLHPFMRYQNGVYISRVIFWLSVLPILTQAGMPNSDN